MENDLVDQFLENRQNYMMENNSIQQLNVASAGDGVVGEVQAEVVSGVAGEILGGKYDEHHEEHDVGDDDELKYVEEVQQSEKQQQQQLQTLKNIGLDDDGTYESNELAEKETSNNAVHEFGNGNGGFVFGGDHHNHGQQQKHDLLNMGNGHDTNGLDVVNISDDFVGTLASTGFEEKLNLMESELDGFKNEGDFSSVSNETELAQGFVPQVDVKIETKLEQQEMVDEDEPSSLATNTTNGTSSLSENIPQQANIESQVNDFDDFIANLENKEDSVPHMSQRPNDLDLEQAQSQLNPEALEFVPRFGSNPASPTSPFASEALPTDEPVLGENMEPQMYFGQAPSVAPRHLLEDDDFVAQSPCKGKDDNNMDTVLLPRALSEFEHEADKRPHEPFIQQDEVMTPDQAIQQLPLDDAEPEIKPEQPATDSTDFQPSNFIDHGPETSVDLETDVDLPVSSILSSLQNDHDDVMKRSMYVTGDDEIEDVLNSVQPIPTEIDSANNSFIEESATESAANQLAGDKELLQVEEKEHVSHSPSTEEIQMNLQNNLNSSNKDIPQIPIDMQESLLVEQVLNAQPDQDEQIRIDMQESLLVEQVLSAQPDQDEQMPIGMQESLLVEQVLNAQPDQDEQNVSFSSENPFATDMLKDQQPTLLMPEEIEKQIIFESEPKPENTIQFDEQILLEDHHIEEEKYEADENQRNVEASEDEKPDEQFLVKDQLENAHPHEVVAEESLFLTTNTNPLTGTENSLEQQMEVNESFSPFKITDDISSTTALESLLNETPDKLQQPEISNTHAVESLDNESHNNLQQADFIDVDMTPSFTANEKHLLEETKEQQLLSVSGLEQQMNEMMLNNTDGNLSQAEDVAAATVIEDITENLTNADEAIDLEEHYRPRQEHEQTEQYNIVDDSFNRHEQECLQQYLLEQKEQKVAFEAEMKTNLIMESLAAQQHPEELKSEIVAVEEPMIEAKQAATLLTTHEETEIKTEEEHELPRSMVPPTTAEPVEVLEPITSITEKEVVIEVAEKQEEQTAEAKTNMVKIPELEEPKENLSAEALKEDVVTTPETTAEVPQEVAVVAAVAAAAATAAVAASKTASSPSAKKPLTKVTTGTATATAKSKAAPSTTAGKKPAEAAKKPIGLAAKPRTVPAKPASVTADKKTTATTTANRKPITATTKVVAKTATTTSTARTLTAAPKATTTSKPTATPRTVPSSTLAARKPATTNGALAKPRAASAPAKPTSLGLSATNGAPKTKPLSPRPTLTTQVRKTNPTTTLASRPKTTTSITSSAAGTTGTSTKTFTARPAPKFTSSSSAATTTTTTKRTTAAGSTTSSTTTTTLKVSSTALRKSTPTKPAASKTPTKSTSSAGGLKSKSPVTKTASPAAKPAPIRKPVDKTIVAAAATTNGEANAADKQLNGLTEEQLNGDMQAVQQAKQQNGDSSIPMQTEKLEQPFLETRYEKIPTDLINA